MAEEQHSKKEIRQLVRLFDADISGDKKVINSLRMITGVSFGMANAVCVVLALNKDQHIGTVSEEDLQRIEAVLKNPGNFGIPSWMFNRRKASETGEDQHLITSNLKLAVEFDIKSMKKIKSYKGVRHSIGQPVRGQKTRSHFRTNKGKGPGVKKGGSPAKSNKEKK